MTREKFAKLALTKGNGRGGLPRTIFFGTRGKRKSFGGIAPFSKGGKVGIFSDRSSEPSAQADKPSAETAPKVFWYSGLYQICSGSLAMVFFTQEMRCCHVAHVKKFTTENMKGLSIHLDRKTENHSNKEIAIERSHLNYDLCEKAGDTLSRLQNRLDDVYCMKRKDVKACCEWIVTLPKELEEKSPAAQRQFFEKTYAFLAARYGNENVVSANVHVDETTPHMHFDFVPVVWDEKKQREKVSAKEVLTRKELQSFHQDLDDYLKKEIPHIYQTGILNGQTLGIEDIKDFKKYADDIKQQKNDRTAELEEVEQALRTAKINVMQLENKKTALAENIATQKEELQLLSEIVPEALKINAKKEKKVVVEDKMVTFGKPKTMQKETGNLVITREEYQKIHGIVNAASTIKKHYDRLQRTDLVQENTLLRQQVVNDRRKKETLQQENERLYGELRSANGRIDDLEGRISDLKDEIVQIYQSTKAFLKEHTGSLQAFKNTLQAFVGKMKERLPGGEFEKAHRREMNKERNRGLER